MAGEDGSVANGDDSSSSSSSSWTAALYANEITDYPFSLDALRKWMIAFVVCDFNVDIGVEVEYMFPSTQFSQTDLQTICFSSFPERVNSDTIEDSAFHFKFRHSSPEVSCEPTEDDPGYWYGFCLFRQQRDISVKRNYRQKSLVLVSQHDFAPLFAHLVKTISTLDFAVSPTLIESACSNIAAWAGPEAGVQELPFLGSLLDVHIPPHPSFPLQGRVTASTSRTDVRVEYKEIHTSEPLGSWARLAQLLTSISELYIIFERVLLSEPLVVLADDPRTCSEFVSAVVDLIRPIPFGGDCRPYLTMQSDFFLNGHEVIPFRHYLIGITNPFFLKRVLSQGKDSASPHVVYLSAPEVKRKSHTFYSSEREFTNNFITNDTKGSLAKDLVFLRKLEHYLKDGETTPQECGRFVRRHFALLSALFLAPLNRYLATLTTLSPNSRMIDIANFSEEDFLASLSKYGCQVQFKGKTSFHRHRAAEAFYRKFCRSPGFFRWLQMKIRLQMADGDNSNGGVSPASGFREKIVDGVQA
ncbi:uncharacterized protein LAJ45_04236 [Morchella importuna]|uniref:DUF1630-domain-containing protein n=1 Tax=Morchella conica CCBAS932 TaxID=1392247 RepID=A0A3N4L3K5_9PEZI|nr:uncharacterized protein LAJ45_04236 [Morchella importuna]KAH8151614.1 hypothetical protein LAJ45_04236 [Morchella importuna]RPB15221.1 DUF1630-domain-containing protein [Morchella conica CCBAS932]